MQSTVERRGDADRRAGWHVAVIMDGNGRWATRRGLPRSAGHRAGVKAVRAVVEAAPDLGIGTLTLFAFSSDNWRRPDPEVRALMGLLRHYLRADLRELVENGVRLSVIGRRDRLPEGLSEEIARVERASAGGQRIDLRLAIDYSARDAITEAAARWLAAQAPSREAFGRLLATSAGEARPAGQASRDVDLLIRSGGEKRLSDFLLWESAYAELCFVDTLWPDFGADELRAAMADFQGRERRFGGLCDVAQLTAAE
ncbi:MAG TPA: di-trans,poly-cis-decaprenylcistransferase [Xanthobacteraceae bacterium]